MLINRKPLFACILCVIGLGLNGSAFGDIIAVPIEHTFTFGGRELTLIRGVELLVSPAQFLPEFGGIECLSCPPSYVDIIDVPNDIFDHIIVPPDFVAGVEHDPTPSPVLDNPNIANLRLTYVGQGVDGPAKLGGLTFEEFTLPPEIASLRYVGYGYDKKTKKVAPNVGVVRFRNSIGDFDDNGLLELADLEKLSEVIISETNDPQFDVNQDQRVDQSDLRFWVEDLRRTHIGDSNLDGTVGFSDFLALSDNFGGSGGWQQGDFDGNGDVEFPDFLALSANFGVAANASAAAVPEPTGVCLALFGFLGLIGFGRRR
jgi:hypothetical protein